MVLLWQVLVLDESFNKSSGTGQVWNDTVANLTLMALGSSAPEILLSARAPETQAR